MGKLLETAVKNSFDLKVHLEMWDNEKRNPEIKKAFECFGFHKNLRTNLILEATKGTAHRNKEKIYKASEKSEVNNEAIDDQEDTSPTRDELKQQAFNALRSYLSSERQAHQL